MAKKSPVQLIVRRDWNITMRTDNTDIENACISYRHDYGLMGPIEREKIRSEAMKWKDIFDSQAREDHTDLLSVAEASSLVNFQCPHCRQNSQVADTLSDEGGMIKFKKVESDWIRCLHCRKEVFAYRFLAA